MATALNICVVGAGSIGCYVGGRLAAAGANVVLIGRERLAAEFRAHGLHLSDWTGADLVVAPGGLRFATSVDAAEDADLVLVTVKSAASTDVGRSLAPALKPGALLISLQNGLNNAALLRAELPRHTVLAGMVEFNVVNRGGGAFHQGSEGGLEVEDSLGLQPFLAAFERSGLPLGRHRDMLAVQWAKLLLNLNNAINALSNIPLREELAQRDFRRCLALAQNEALQLLDVAGIQPAQLTPIPPRWIPRLLGTPDFLFRRLANKMLAIDPVARSSMWEDLEAGRVTEVDWLNGEVVRLAHSQGRHAPVNARLVALIRAAEQGGRRDWKGPALLDELRQSIAPTDTGYS